MYKLDKNFRNRKFFSVPENAFLRSSRCPCWPRCAGLKDVLVPWSILQVYQPVASPRLGASPHSLLLLLLLLLTQFSSYPEAIYGRCGCVLRLAQDRQIQVSASCRPGTSRHLCMHHRHIQSCPAAACEVDRRSGGLRTHIHASLVWVSVSIQGCYARARRTGNKGLIIDGRKAIPAYGIPNLHAELYHAHGGCASRWTGVVTWVLPICIIG